MILLCRLGIAPIYQALGEVAAFDENISVATDLAREMGDKNALFHLALMQFSQSGAEEFREEAEGLVGNLDTVRDKAILYLTLLERENLLGTTEKSAGYIDQANIFFEEQSEDIDQARYNLALAQHYYLMDDLRQASDYGERAAARARKVNLLPEQWQALAFLSEMAFKAKDFEAAFTNARQATETLKKIAGHIKEKERLVHFYNDRRVVALLGRIKSLQTILSKTKGAAVGGP